MAELDHARNSQLRELIVEHLFVGEALRQIWEWGFADVEVLRSEADAFGYDLVMARGGTVRHIQLKTLIVGGKAGEVKISLRLMEKPSGCVIWIVVTKDLRFDHFLWFGGLPDEPLPSIQDLRVAKHTKANAAGTKSERPDHRIVPRTRFRRVSSLEEILVCLFGEF